MDTNLGWQKSYENYEVFYAKDNQCIDELGLKIDIEKLAVNRTDDKVNLGIRNYDNRLYSSNYVGICYLKDKDGNNIKTKDTQREVVFKVGSRFNISIIDILNYIRSDDEFERYLAPQTIRKNQQDIDIESLESNELFHFFQNEKPIKLQTDMVDDSSIINVTLFLTALKELCRRPLMGKMIKCDENLTGKLKGKVLFNQHIKSNVIKGRNDRIYCQYLKYSYDIKENQILKCALVKAGKFIKCYFKGISSKNTNYTEVITYCNKALENITYKKISVKDCEGLKFSGCYSYYKDIIQLAKMVINEVSIDINGHAKNTNIIMPYAVSMEKLFEIYIRAYLKNNGFSSYKNSDSIKLQLGKYDDKKSIFENSKRGMANYIGGVIKPDIIIRNPKNNEIIIFDVKYKDYRKKRYAREDRLQLLAYALMYNCSHVGLIFPQNFDEEIDIFEPQKIQSLEKREIKYHQLAIKFNEHNLKNEQSISEYIKSLL